MLFILFVAIFFVIASGQDPSLVPIHCKQDTLRESTCKGIRGHDVRSLANTIYPWDRFCLVYNSTMVTIPGLVKYGLTASLCRIGNNLHGDGMFFNYQDENNYEIIYMYSRNSSICILGYVEEGLVYNKSTFACPNDNNWIEWMQYSVEINQTHGVAMVTDGGPETHSITFTPTFPLSVIGGPMILNSDIHYDFLEFGSTDFQTETCKTSPELCDSCSFAYNIINQPVYPLPDYRNFLLWHSRALEMVYNSCYFKVLVDTTKEIVVNVTSQVGTFEYDDGVNTVRPGDFYGERHACISNMAVCVQVKAAGSVTNGQEVGTDRTKMLLTIQDEALPVVKVNEALELIYGDSIIVVDTSLFIMLLDELVYGPEFGIYCFTSKNAVESERAALNMCLNGSNDPTQPPPGEIDRNGWAVQFSETYIY